MGDIAEGETSDAATGRPDSSGRSLRWAWLASVGIVAFTIALALGAYVLTTGEPHCRFRGGVLVRFCPWYRQYVRNAALLFVGFSVVVVPSCLLVGFARAVLRDR